MKHEATEKFSLPKRWPELITIMNAMTDVTRISIIYLLGSNGRMTSGEIAKYFPMSRPAISNHLKILYQSRLVERLKVGQQTYYTFNHRLLRRAFMLMTTELETWEPSDDNLFEPIEKS